MMFSNGRWIICYFGFLLSAAAIHADPTILPLLSLSEDKIRTKDFKGAISVTEPLLVNLKLETIEEIIRAHRILGVAYCELGEQEKSAEHFDSLLSFSSSETLAGLTKTQFCQDLFLKTKADKAAALSSTPPTPIPKKVGPVVPIQNQDKTWLLYVPFGTGQFQNGEKKKGIGFLSSELVLSGAAVTTALLFDSEKMTGGLFKDPDRASLYRILFFSSVGLDLGAMVWGIVDAVSMHKTVESKRSFQFKISGQGPRVSFNY